MEASPSMTYASDANAIESILERCVHVDRRFQDWRRTIPSQCETLSPCFGSDQPSTPTNSTFYPNHMLTYPTLHIAEMDNQHRLHRIKLQIIIMKCASKMAVYHSNQSQKYAEMSAGHEAPHRVCLDTVNDICATVPFHFGEKPTSLGPTPNEIPRQIPNLGPQSPFELPTCTDHSAQQGAPTATRSIRSTGSTTPPSGRNTPQPALRKNMGYFMLL